MCVCVDLLVQINNKHTRTSKSIKWRRFIFNKTRTSLWSWNALKHCISLAPQTGRRPSTSLDIRQSLHEPTVVCAIAGKWRMDISQPRGLILVHNYQPGKVQAMVLQWAYRPGEGGGVKGLQTPPHFKAKFERKKCRFCKDGDVKFSTCLGVRPEPDTEIGCWLVRWNFEKMQ